MTESESRVGDTPCKDLNSTCSPPPLRGGGSQLLRTHYSIASAMSVSLFDCGAGLSRGSATVSLSRFAEVRKRLGLGLDVLAAPPAGGAALVIAATESRVGDG